MSTALVEAEKFDAIKELASIQTEIASARAVLNSLAAEKSEFIQKREEEVLGRVQQLLDASSDALRQIHGNFDELVAYKKQIIAAAEEMQGVFALFKQLRDDFEVQTKAQSDELEKRVKHLEIIKIETAVIKGMVETERKALAAEHDWIRKEKARINDDRQAIIRQMERMKK